jgi:hypothetical protein
VRHDRVEQPIRADEVVAALSLATDLGTAQPPGDPGLVPRAYIRS